MSAVISPCGAYRYALERILVGPLEWPARAPSDFRYRGKTWLVIMLNPSVADAERDDPTIRELMRRAKDDGASRLLVGNLYALRATDPSALALAADPIGEKNDEWLAAMAASASRVIVAWGAHPLAKARDLAVMAILRHHYQGQLLCLGTTADGSPKHPLARGRHRIPRDFAPVPWRPA